MEALHPLETSSYHRPRAWYLWDWPSYGLGPYLANLRSAMIAHLLVGSTLAAGILFTAIAVMEDASDFWGRLSFVWWGICLCIGIFWFRELLYRLSRWDRTLNDLAAEAAERCCDRLYDKQEVSAETLLREWEEVCSDHNKLVTLEADWLDEALERVRDRASACLRGTRSTAGGDRAEVFFHTGYRPNRLHLTLPGDRKFVVSAHERLSLLAEQARLQKALDAISDTAPVPPFFSLPLPALLARRLDRLYAKRVIRGLTEPLHRP